MPSGTLVIYNNTEKISMAPALRMTHANKERHQFFGSTDVAILMLLYSFLAGLHDSFCNQAVIGEVGKPREFESWQF